MPPPDLNLGPGVIVKLGLSSQGGCVLFENGELRCWGKNNVGQLGIGSVNHIGDGPGEMPPVATNYGAGVIVDMTGGDEFFTILLADGSVRNWGKALSLGYGSGGNIGDGQFEMPPNTVALGGLAIALSRGNSQSQHSCVMLQDSTVRCWGYNPYGQLGLGHVMSIGDNPGEMPPAPVPAF